MNSHDFVKNPSLKPKVYVLNGDDEYFKHSVKVSLQDAHKIPLTYVDASEPDFYTKIDTLDLMPEPKLFFLNNSSGGLEKQKFFWNYVKDSPKDSRYIISNFKIKDVPEGVTSLEVECEKVKDSARDVIKVVNEMLTQATLVLDAKDVAYFYYLYRNDLFASFNEIQKCKLWAKSTGVITLTFKDLQGILSPITHSDVFGFVNNFTYRRLKACLSEISELEDNDVLPYTFNLFKSTEKILAYKSARRAGLTDDEFIKGLELNIYYFKYTLKLIEPLWKESELRSLLIALENINYKIKSFNFPCTKAIVALTLKYCR